MARDIFARNSEFESDDPIGSMSVASPLGQLNRILQMMGAGSITRPPSVGGGGGGAGVTTDEERGAPREQFDLLKHLPILGPEIRMGQAGDLQERMMGLQAGREKESLQQKADLTAEMDPVAAITRALSRGESPMSSNVEALMKVIGERFGAKGVGGEDKVLTRQVLSFIRGTPRRLDQRLSQVKDPGEGAAPEERNAYLMSRREAYMTEIRELYGLAQQHPDQAEAAKAAIAQIAQRAQREGVPGVALVGNRLGTRAGQTAAPQEQDPLLAMFPGG